MCSYSFSLLQPAVKMPSAAISLLLMSHSISCSIPPVFFFLFRTAASGLDVERCPSAITMSSTKVEDMGHFKQYSWDKNTVFYDTVPVTLEKKGEQKSKSS